MQTQEFDSMTVASLRTLARANTSLSGLAIAGMRKKDLVRAMNGGNGNNGHGENKEIRKDSLADVIAAALQGRIKAEGIDRKEVSEIVKTELASLNLKQTIEIKNLDNGIVKDMGLQHKDFNKLLTLANNRLDTMLVGAAGSGKTTICHAVADALSLPFYMVSVGQQTTKTDLMGYMDATGNYIKTHLRSAYEQGGVFLLDEVDAGNANVITVLNSLLSNGLASFPDKMITRHKDFIFFCAANTYGRGNDRQYIGRNQLDAASLDRFVSVNFDYDEVLEAAISINQDFTKKIQAIRKTVFELKLQIVVSPRASIKGGQLLQAGFPEDTVLDMVVFKGCNQDIKNKIMSNIGAC